MKVFHRFYKSWGLALRKKNFFIELYRKLYISYTCNKANLCHLSWHILMNAFADICLVIVVQRLLKWTTSIVGILYSGCRPHLYCFPLHYFYGRQIVQRLHLVFLAYKGSVVYCSMPAIDSMLEP